MKKIRARLNIIIFFDPPPLESAPAKRRQPYCGPLDEVSALRLGAAVVLRASGRQRPPAPSCGRKHLKVEHRDVVTRSMVPVSASTYVGYHNIMRQVPIRLMDFTME